jgi:hypothetical protein
MPATSVRNGAEKALVDHVAVRRTGLTGEWARDILFPNKPRFSLLRNT